MIRQNDLERERELARVKVERDQLSRLHSARLDGLEEGQLIGSIHVYQRLLKRPPTPNDELLALSTADLRQMVLQLERELPQ